MKLKLREITDFQDTVWGYYRVNARQLPWRDDPSPYRVVVSELMLQQTQVSRVLPKFEQFISIFPDWQSLATAPLSDVLRAWSGLGYNRRAKFLWQTAQCVVSKHSGQLPTTEVELIELPGIGKNTAGAVVAYAFNKPAIFVETNIRTVYFKHFFPADKKVSDREILELVKQTLPQPKGKEQTERRIYSAPGLMRKTEGLSHYRVWYWALMDYGSYLKKTSGGQLETSTHYKKQSKLAGSLRETRGLIVKQLVGGSMTTSELQTRLPADDRFEKALTSLLSEGMIVRRGEVYSLTGAVDAR